MVEVKIWQGMPCSAIAEVSVGNVYADNATIRPPVRDFRGQATRATSDV